MKRRNILGAAGIAGIPVIARGTSIYGTPSSVVGVTKPVAAPLTRIFDVIRLPVETVPLMQRFGRVWDQVLGDPSERRKFQNDPAGFLDSSGIPRSVLDARDPEVLLLKAMADEEVLLSALSGNYQEFLNRLKALGVSAYAGKSGLKRHLVKILRENLAEINSRLAARQKTFNGSNPAYEESREIIYLYGQLAPSLEQVAVAAIPVAIAAIAAVYVSVAAVVSVGVLAGVYVSLAVMTAITAGPNECRNRPFESLVAGPEEMPRTWRTEQQRRAQHALAQRELIGRRMLLLGPERLQEAQQTARLARLLHKDEFVLAANRQLVLDEVQIFLEAAEEVGLLHIPEISRENVVVAIQKIVLRITDLD